MRIEFEYNGNEMGISLEYNGNVTGKMDIQWD